MRKVFFLVLLAALAGCESTYYSAMEKVGVHKRDILVDRVEEARDAQEDAEEEFQDALEQLSILINFDGGELQRVYEELNSGYEDSLGAAEEVSERIAAIEQVADALFEEWSEEITEYKNATFRRESQKQLRLTKQRYLGLLAALRKAESRMKPVLSTMRDNVLYLKHNLNAQAVAALKVEFGQIEQDIGALIAEMRRAIASSNEFIDSMQQTPAG